MIFNGPPWKRQLPGLGPRPLVAHSPRIAPPADAKVGQSLLEVAGYGVPGADVGQSLLEVVGYGVPTANVGQSFLEVLVYYSRYPGDQAQKPPFTRIGIFFPDEPITRFPRRFTPDSALVNPVFPFVRPISLFQNYENEWQPPAQRFFAQISTVVPVVGAHRSVIMQRLFEEEWHPPGRGPIAPPVRSGRKLLFTVV